MKNSKVQTETVQTTVAFEISLTVDLKTSIKSLLGGWTNTG